MKSILAQLAEGRSPLELNLFKPGSQYGQTLGELAVIENELLKVLKEEELGLFKEFSEAQAELNHLSGVEQFIYGYRLGTLITAEVFMISHTEK